MRSPTSSARAVTRTRKGWLRERPSDAVFETGLAGDGLGAGQGFRIAVVGLLDALVLVE